jgi:predicted Zn-dependent peptidase
MEVIYGSSPVSKLFMNIREKLSLCYYCSADYQKSTSSMCVDAGIDGQNLEKAKENIMSEFKAIQNGEFSEEELITAKQLLKHSFSSISDSIRSLDTWYLQRVIDTTYYSPEQYIELIDLICKEDIIKLANTFNLTTVYILKGVQKVD